MSSQTVSVSALIFSLVLLGCSENEAPVQPNRTINTSVTKAPTAPELTTPETNVDNAAAECCSCRFGETIIFPGNADFQCSFAYPAHWEASYDPWENSVLVTAPRCKTRCGGARSMAFTISRGKDNNADYQEGEWAKSANIVGNSACGGRAVTLIRPPGTVPGELIGKLNFHVGNHDDKAYDASALFSCSVRDEWQLLERLFIESLDDRVATTGN